MKFKKLLLFVLILLIIAFPVFTEKQVKRKLRLKVYGGIQFFTDFYQHNETKNYGSSSRNVIFGVHGKLYKKITFMIRIKGDYGYGIGFSLKSSRVQFDIKFSPHLHLTVGKEFVPTSRFALYDLYQFNKISAHRVGHYTYIGSVIYLYTIYAFETICPDQGIYFWGKYSLLKNFHIKYYASFLNGFYTVKEPLSKKGRFVGRVQLNFGRAESGYYRKSSRTCSNKYRRQLYNLERPQ